jgi:hypothetical protein
MAFLLPTPMCLPSPFLKKDSFLHNVHQYAAQEFLIGLIVIKTFFMSHLKHHENDVEWCIQAIFHPSH